MTNQEEQKQTESSSRQGREGKRKQQEDRLFWGVLAVFVVLALITGIYSFQFIRQTVASGGQAPTFGGPSGSEGSDAGDAEVAPTPNQPEVEVALAQWDGSSRVNILVLGLDYIDWREGEGPPRSDTMILVSIDPVDKTATMLSIPRDLWINIPGFGSERINTAYMNGEAARLPGGGPALAVKTVEEFLGIEIHYFAEISFDTFVQFVDMIGGLKIDVPAELKITLAYKEGHKVLQPGRQVFNGEYALAYIRARNSEGGDFDRAERQQQAIFAIRDRMLEPRIAADMIANAVEYWNIFSAGVRTNITFDEAFKLGLLAIEIEQDNISQHVIGPPDYVTLETTDGGAQVLKPVANQIRILRDEIFSSNTVAAPLANTLDIAELLTTENARVAVLNGSGVAGLASTTEAYLLSLGINVIESGNADEFVSYTKVYDYTGKLYTMQYLVETMRIQSNKIFNRYDPESAFDIVIILGPDWQVP